MKSVVILAGGKSTRMGKDKIFLHVCDGVTFVEYLYQNAKNVFDRVVISAGSTAHAEKISALLPDAEVIQDRYCDIGPMGGIVSVFEKTEIRRFAVVPVDVPYADFRILRFFYEQCGEESCLLKTGNRPEPLLAAYGEEALLRMQNMVLKGEYRLQNVICDRTRLFMEEDLKKRLPELKDLDFQSAFSNINTFQDYLEQIK